MHAYQGLDARIGQVMCAAIQSWCGARSSISMTISVTAMLMMMRASLSALLQCSTSTVRTPGSRAAAQDVLRPEGAEPVEVLAGIVGGVAEHDRTRERFLNPRRPARRAAHVGARACTSPPARSPGHACSWRWYLPNARSCHGMRRPREDRGEGSGTPLNVGGHDSRDQLH
ncbi:MAG: hypothetical protein IT383_15365 [Deltaproteobacteria bacterium]|nr:hypothetical protein [Deltaproteobacteria bacterium]